MVVVAIAFGGGASTARAYPPNASFNSLGCSGQGSSSAFASGAGSSVSAYTWSPSCNWVYLSSFIQWNYNFNIVYPGWVNMTSYFGAPVPGWQDITSTHNTCQEGGPCSGGNPATTEAHYVPIGA